MESFGLYEDLSLFSGDMLVGMNPLADELPILGQDGCIQEPQMFPAQVDLFADDFIKPPKPDPPVDDDWMEKKIDLINLLSSPNVHITLQDSQSDANDSFVPSQCGDVIAPTQIVEEESTYQEMQPAFVAVETLMENVTEYLSSDIDDLATSHSANMPFDDLGVGDFGTVDGLASLLSDQDMTALNDPILSPVSPQDVESILSAEPSSPCSTASINDGVVPQIKTVDDSFFLSNEDQSQSSGEVLNGYESSHRSALSPGPVRPIRASRAKKYSPYKDFDDGDDEDFKKKSSTRAPRTVRSPDRKERKKQQNKDAALRYRLKKKQEQNTVFEECDELEKKNDELKDKVDSMTREIQYLKDLLLEVYKAKGIQPKGLLVK